MTEAQINEYLLGLEGVRREYPFDEQAAVYKYGQAPEGKIIAIVYEGSQPLRISLKCDPQLARNLRDKYESVQPGYKLNKNHWNTIICSGQLGGDEIIDLARLSYEIVRAES